MKTKNLQYAMFTAVALASAATVRADITGSLWEAPASGLVDHVSDSVPANPPVSTPNVTFTVANGALDFTSVVGDNNSASYTIGPWLNSNPGGANILTGSSELGNTMNDVLIQFQGQVTVTSGQTFTVAHDDGMTLTIGGMSVIDVPGPTSPETTTVTYAGPSGTFDFNLLYAEVDGAPAVLNLDLPLQPVPEASTVLAGALLLLPLGASTMRVLRQNRAA